MANKTVRVLRTLPREGVIYRANDLITVSDRDLELLPSDALDGEKAAVDYCKSIGVKPVKYGQDPRAQAEPSEPEPSGDDESGEIAE